MKKFVSLLIISLFIVCSGCNSKNRVLKEIKIDGQKITVINLDQVPKQERVIPLSELFSDFQEIPLETREECLIQNTMIELSEDDIFVGTQNFPGPARLYRFDMNGKFLNEIGRPGRGPGEHSGYMQDFIRYYDKDSTIIVVWNADNPQLFNLRGQLLQIIQWPYHRMMDIYKLGNEEWFSTGSAGGRPHSQKDSVLLVFYNNEGTISRVIPRTTFPEATRKGFIPTPWDNSVWDYKGKIKVFLPGIDTIYTLENRELIPAGILLSGNKSLPYDKILSQEELKGKYRIRILAETEYNWFIEKSVINSVKLIQYAPNTWGGQFDEDSRIIIIDKKSGNAAQCKFKDDLYGFFPEEAISYITWHRSGKLFLALPPVNIQDMIKEYELKGNVPSAIAERLKLIKQIKEDDNPVIFLFTLKDRIKIEA